jgi:arsenite-transporting ATPase
VPGPRRSPQRTIGSRASTRRSRGTNTPATDARHQPPPAAPHFRFIGGKGGVGKTTCAAAIAVDWAAAGHRTLVISTDPASSLGDAFNRDLSRTPRRIPLRRGALYAVEIDAAQALERWLAPRRDAFERIALRGTWLDREDVSRLLSLSLPGIDELAALIEITRFAGIGRYDRIVVDTAPTGHTLRMLMMPESLQAIATVFDRMQAKHRIMTEALRGGWAPDPDDRLIDEIDRDGRELHALLRDPALVHVSWVTLPELMAVEETVDAASALSAAGIPLRDVIVNQLTLPPGRRCGWCDGRRTLERRAVAALRARVRAIPLIGVRARITEPRDVRTLAEIGQEIGSGTGASPARPGGMLRPWRPQQPLQRDRDVLSGVSVDRTRLILFGGKGGVGKTTCAAAAALALASAAPERRVLLLSTDPAHSLADALGTPLTDSPAPVRNGPPNLLARELDAAQKFRQVRTRYAAAIDSLFDRLTRDRSGTVGVDAGQDRQVMHALIELAPPGIDELAAVIDVTDALDSGTTDLVLMDTAPSGHALRLLEMPALVQGWVKALMSILLKYQPVIGVGELGAVLLQLSQGLSRLRALLVDAERTSFVVVTRAAALPAAETARLRRRLERLHVHVPLVVVNAVGRGTCPGCRAVAQLQQLEVDRLVRSLSPTTPVALAPAELPPPHGVRALIRWRRTWQPHRKIPRSAGISSTRTT